jgi:regulator of protease activity HflC (stomatin/prohibitin superfamily)
MKKTDDFFDKTKEMADKAEAILDATFEKVKKSEAYGKITDAMEQVGAIVEKKIEEIKESDIPGQAERLRDKAETQTEQIIEQAKAYGSVIASDLDEVIDSLKEKLSGNEPKKNKDKA